MIVDVTVLVDLRRRELLHEAKLARLAAEVPRHPSAVRRELALACHRLAVWLDWQDVSTFGSPSRDVLPG
jgi:hypothetical protein